MERSAHTKWISIMYNSFIFVKVNCFVRFCSIAVCNVINVSLISINSEVYLSILMDHVFTVRDNRSHLLIQQADTLLASLWLPPISGH